MSDLPAGEKSTKLEQMLEHHTTSYKLYWLFAVLMEARNGQQILTFRQVVIRMVTLCWYSITQFRLNLGAVDRIDGLVRYLSGKYPLPVDILEEELHAFLTRLNDPEAERHYGNFYRYVPYRLLQPFFSAELSRIPDPMKNRIIESNSRTSKDVFYRVFARERKIAIQPDWFEYVQANQAVIHGWILYRLIGFLQKRNPSMPGIPLKISAPRTRDLSAARQFWKALARLQPIVDIYTSNELSPSNFKRFGSLSVDHFLPWSFVVHDEMWNLVPTFRHINSSKRDRLPCLDAFFDGFCELQYTAFTAACRHHRLRRYAQDYISLDPALVCCLKSGRPGSRTEFKQTLRNAIFPLYRIAFNSGYAEWTAS